MLHARHAYTCVREWTFTPVTGRLRRIRNQTGYEFRPDACSDPIRAQTRYVLRPDTCSDPMRAQIRCVHCCLLCCIAETLAQDVSGLRICSRQDLRPSCQDMRHHGDRVKEDPFSPLRVFVNGLIDDQDFIRVPDGADRGLNCGTCPELHDCRIPVTGER